MFSFIKNLFGKSSGLMKLMPEVRGSLTANAPLNNLNWLGVGGPAEILYTPADEEDLSWFLSARPNVPVTVMGGGSNLLIRDGGIPGVVIRLGKEFSKISVEGNRLICGTAAKNAEVAKAAADAGLSGFEFLAGIPGTIGGAIRMNAGAHGSEIKDILTEMSGVDGIGKKFRISKGEIPLEYRLNPLPVNWIFTGAVFEGRPENKENIQKRMAEYREIRERSQPVGVRTAGSMFKNPVGLKAWQLIDKAGCRGLRVGGAMVSEKHCNFFINTGKATAEDFETLAETVREKVFEASNIRLEWEVRRIGVASKRSGLFGDGKND